MDVVVTTRSIRHAKLQSNIHHQQTNTRLFTGRMSFLPPNQQHHSTEGKSLGNNALYKLRFRINIHTDISVQCGMQKSPQQIYLIIKHEQQRTLDVLIARPFHLKPIGLLRCCRTMPLQAPAITMEMNIEKSENSGPMKKSPDSKQVRTTIYGLFPEKSKQASTINE